MRQANLQAAAQRQQGEMALWQGDQQQQASTIGAIGTGLQGLSGAASQYDEAVYRGTMKDSFGLYPRTK